MSKNTTPRPSLDEYFMAMTQLVATRGTCIRRAVGCVLVNHRGHVLSTGYNGVASGRPHCNEAVPFWVRPSDPGPITTYPHTCEGADAASGQSLDSCQAIHAEQNALLQCKDVWDIKTAYVTASPCVTCTKLLLNTSCERIVFLEEYPQPAAKEMWIAAGREWLQST